MNIFKKRPQFIIELHHGSDKEWDSIIAGFAHFSIYHTAEFGHIYEEIDKNTRVLRYMVFDSRKENILSVCLVLYFPAHAVAMWFYGPLFRQYPNIEYSQAEVIAEIMQCVGKQGARFLQPASLPYGLPLPENDQIYLQKRGCDIHEHGTFIVKIDGNTSDKIWNSFDRSVRKNINKCERMGVVVRALDTFQEVEKDYLPILRETRERLGFSMPPFYPNQYAWQWLHQKGSILEVFLAYLDGAPLAGLGLFGLKDGKVIELAVAYSNQFYEEKIPAHDLIKWKIIEWGRTHHIKEYDLGGVDPKATDEKSLGIYRFKKKFGGDYYPGWILSKEF